MKKLLLSVLFVLSVMSVSSAATTVEMKTSLGTVVIELDGENAPVTVKNFLDYVDQNFYDGTIFHRVIKGFMIQGGGFDTNAQRKTTMKPIKNEATNGLLNEKGTIAMARTGVVDSATSQFFINLVDNDFLNNRGRTARTYGYAVFGRVIDGMDVVEKIGRIRTVAKSAAFKDFPEPKVVIESIRRIE
jgi:cyclophilin family peptidyl-prolyl cis-trans isomerase